MELDQLIAQLEAVDVEIDALLLGDTLSADQRAQHDRLQGRRQQVLDAIEREEDRRRRAAERDQLRQRSQAAQVQAERDANRVGASRRLTDPEPPTRNQTPVTQPQAVQPADTIRAGNTLPPLTGLPAGMVPAGTDGAAIVGQIMPASFAGVPANLPYFGRLTGKHGLEVFAGTQPVTLANGLTVNLSGEQRAYRFGMWALATLGQQYPGTFGRSEACQYAQRWVAQHMPNIQAAVLSTDASGYQFTIPIEFSRDIIVLREQYGVARRLLRRETMVGDKKVIPRRQSGLTAYWTSEGGVITPSNKIWNDVELIAKDMTAISVVSAQVNADTIVPWAADIADEIAYAFSLAEDQAAFLGDGTSTYGKCVGVIQKLKTPDSSANASAGLKTASGSGWSGVTLANLQALIGLLPQYADTGNCTFLSHRTFFYTIIQPLLTALGGVNLAEVTTAPNQGAGQGYAARPLVLGYPWTFSQVWPAATASSQVCCSFGDFNKGAAMGDRQQLSIAFSDQGYVAGVSLFERNLLGIRGTQRIDINVHDAGTSSSGTPASTPGPICGLITA